MDKPTPGDAEKLVEKLFADRAKEGHWDSSGLTETEWRTARRAIASSLESILRPRIRYPRDRRAQKNHPHPLDQSPTAIPTGPAVLPSQG
jgi:membrane-associated HD superfamily phosphohydrolase